MLGYEDLVSFSLLSLEYPLLGTISHDGRCGAVHDVDADLGVRDCPPFAL